MLGGYFNRNLPQGTIAVLKVEDAKAPGDEDARHELAARRRVLSVRHGAVGCGAARRQHRRALQEQDPDGLLARSRARAPQPRHRAHGHVEAAEPETRRRLSAGVDTRIRQGPNVLHVTWPSRRHLVRTIRSSELTSTEAFDGRSGSKTDRSRSSGLRAAGLRARAGRRLPSSPHCHAPAFHHLHLNSVNPEAAIEFYVKAFPSTSKGTFAGQPALRSPNNVWCCSTRSPRRRRRSRRPRSGISAGTSPTCARRSIAT